MIEIPICECDFQGIRMTAINARDLHAYVRSFTQFCGWMKVQIRRHSLVEGVDYVRIPVARHVQTRGWKRVSHQFDYYLSPSAVERIGTTIINPQV